MNYTFVCRFSILNLLQTSTDDVIMTQFVINFAILFLLFLLIEEFKIYNRFKVNVLERDKITARDFTIIIKHLPLDFQMKDIEQHLSKYAPGCIDELQRVIMIYNMSEYAHLKSAETQLTKEKLRLLYLSRQRQEGQGKASERPDPASTSAPLSQ